MLTNICYLNIVEGKPIFLSNDGLMLNDIKLMMKDGTIHDDLNFIQLYKNKYGKEQIEEQKFLVFSNLDGIIEQVKEILVILTDGKLTMDVENDQVNHLINTKIIEFDFDLDAFFSNIGANLSNYYNSNNFNKYDFHLNSSNKKIMAYQTLYYYMVELEHIMFYSKNDIDLGFVHAYFSFGHFLNVFNLLLKIKKKLYIFFSYLLKDEKVYDKSINLFFLQFEYLVLIDIFHNNSLNHFNKFGHSFGYDTIRKHYAQYCKDSSIQSFDMYFSNISIFNVEMFSIFKHALYTALENDFHSYLNSKASCNVFGRSLEDRFINSLFVIKEDDKCVFLYDDIMIDFNYLFSMVNSLKYTYLAEPRFLNNFMNKYA